MQDERTMRYAEKLSRMIQVPTVSAFHETDFSRFYRFHDLLKKLFPNLFGLCEVEDFSGSLLLRWKGRSSDAPIMFMNHLDVVEAGGRWKHDPFSGDIADGCVWGRGTLDTKGGLCCMLQAAEELAENGFVPQKDIYFVSTCTEETDGSGADLIAQTLAERGVHCAFILDEGGGIVTLPLAEKECRYAMIGVGEKGCVELKFVAHSDGGHASMPGKNTPLVRLSGFIRDVENSHIFTEEISPVLRELLTRVAPEFHGFRKLALKHPSAFAPVLRKQLPKFSPMMGAMLRTTLAFTMAKGSDAINTLPTEAWITGDMRFSHHQGMEASVNALRKIAVRHGVEMIVKDPGVSSPVSDFRSEGFKKAENVLFDIFPSVSPTPYITNTASDSRFMSRVSDVCLRFTPFIASQKQIDSIHGVNENISLSSLAPAVDFYRKMMQ